MLSLEGHSEFLGLPTSQIEELGLRLLEVESSVDGDQAALVAILASIAENGDRLAAMRIAVSRGADAKVLAAAYRIAREKAPPAGFPPVKKSNVGLYVAGGIFLAFGLIIWKRSKNAGLLGLGGVLSGYEKRFYEGKTLPEWIKYREEIEFASGHANGADLRYLKKRIKAADKAINVLETEKRRFGSVLSGDSSHPRLAKCKRDEESCVSACDRKAQSCYSIAERYPRQYGSRPPGVRLGRLA